METKPRGKEFYLLGGEDLANLQLVPNSPFLNSGFQIGNFPLFSQDLHRVSLGICQEVLKVETLNYQLIPPNQRIPEVRFPYLLKAGHLIFRELKTVDPVFD